MTTATDDRRRLSIGQGIQAHTRSGAIGGGGCYTAPDGEPVVILCVDPHTGQPFEHELRAGQTFLLGNEEWEVSGVQGSSNPRWMASLAPFGVADGLVARAAGRLTLVARGLDPKSVTVPEVGHVDSGREYADALAAYASGGADGVARWLVHCCSALALGAREGLAICEAVLRG